MKFKEFGNKKNKAIILIHGYGISWKMWMPQIEVFSKDFFVIVPVLDGHDTEKSSTFTTVEKAATDIIDYVTQIYGEHIFAICGASLGATIAIDVLAQDRLKVDKAIIDGGPVVPMNKLLLSFFIKMRIKQAHMMKKGSKFISYMFNRTYIPKEMVDEVLRIGANMTDESCRNLHLSAFRYSLPTSIANIKTDVTYWYGSKEAMFGKKYAKAILEVLPNAKIKVFKGFEHGELCIGNPDIYISEAMKFFNSLKLKLGKINLEYFLSGKENKETIVFVHGLGANLSQFENQHQFFQDKYKVLSLDLRGHGNTTESQELTESDFELSKLSNDIVMLFDKLGIKKAHYIGHSMGGNVGYELLKNNSDKLLSFTTFGTTAKLNKSEIIIKFMKIIYKLLSAKIIAQLSSFDGRNKNSKKKIQEMMRQTRKETILKIIPHLARFNYLNVIKRFNIPSMIIKGDMDKEINKVIGGTIEAWQEKDNFRLIEMKNTGHFANLDNPKRFNKIIESFLENIEK